MRNLKRALSLGLTAAMISGLMVMGSSAASYADVTSEDNVEAIEVLEAVGIMIGDENGDFNPDQNVTRNEMAVVMSNLMEYNVASYKDTSPFTDVPSWAEPYVAACWTNGITAGTSATTYGGSDNVTTSQAALMLMKALGYFQYSQDFGADWQLATVKQGNNIDLFVGVDSGVTQAMTRNDVAQLVLNTLEAGTVQAETDGSLTVGNVTIATDVKYNYVTSNQTYATAIDDARSTSNTTDANRSIVELGEQLYMGDLKLEDGTLDDFGRPSRTWSYEGQDIGTYAKRALLQTTYTEAVEGGEVYNDIGATASDYDLTYTVDGVELSAADTAREAAKLERRNDDDMNSTGTGAQTEVYVDTNEEETYIVVINTYLAEAATDYRTNTEDILINVYDGANAGTPPTTSSTTYTVEVEDIPEIEDLAEGDMLLVRIADDEIFSIDTPEVVSDVEISEYDADRVDANPYTDYQLNSLTAGDGEYDANVKTFWDAEFIYDHETEDLDNATYNLYLDFFGNVIGVEQVEADDNYVFIVGYDENTSHLAQAVDDALAIFPDGRIEPIDVRDDELAAADQPGWLVDDGDGNSNVNRWYTYTMDGEVYILESLVDRQIIASEDSMNTDVLDRDHSTIQDMYDNAVAVGNSESVFITVDVDDEVEAVTGSIVDVNGIVTGIQDANVELEYDNTLTLYNDNEDEMVFAVYDSKGYIEYAVVVGTCASSDDYVYLTSGTQNHGISNGNYYWTYTGITKDGEITFRSYTSEDQNGDQLAAGNLYKMDFNEDGEVTRNGAEIVYALASADLNTEGYRDAGYGLTWINSVQTLYANGLTFQYDIANNNNFVHLDPDCTFFVNDSRVNDNEYVEYGTVSAALNALGADHRFTGTVAALINSNGFAQVLILNDTFTGNDNAGAQQGGVVTPGVTVSIDRFNQIAVTTTDRVLTDEDVVDEIVSYLTQSGLIVDEPTQTGARTWTFRTYYDLGNGTRIPAETYTFNAGADLTQNITYFVNGVEQPVVASGTPLQGKLTGKGELVEVNGTMYDINSDDVGYPDLPATTEVESGKNYVVYSTVTNADGETLTGVVDTKVVDTKADFLSGTILNDATLTPVGDVTFDATNKIVADGYYKVTKNSRSYAKQLGDSITFSGDYALINDVMTSVTPTAPTVTGDMEIVDGYYKLVVTDATPSVVDSYVWSGDTVVKVGNDYYAQAGDATLTITTKQIAPASASDDVLTIGGSGASLTGAKFDTSNVSTPISVSGNTITFKDGETWASGTITVELTVGSGDYTVTLSLS